MSTRTQSSKESTEAHELSQVDGHVFFAVGRAIRTQCAITTIARLPRLGKKAPRCYEYLGRTLGLLDQIACCAWGCPGTEEGHLLHRLIGRGVSNGNAGTELTLIGQYDEAIASARAIGEIANLLWLFEIDRPTMADWQSLEPKMRWREYSPGKVRRKIQALGEPLLVEEQDYRLLSKHGVHVTPTTSPNTMGLNHQPSLGGRYRDDALLVCINEIAWAVGVLSLPSVKLLGPAKGARMVLKTARTLLNSVGGVRARTAPKFTKMTDTV